MTIREYCKWLRGLKKGDVAEVRPAGKRVEIEFTDRAGIIADGVEYQHPDAWDHEETDDPMPPSEVSYLWPAS